MFIQNLTNNIKNLWSNTHAEYDKRHIEETCTKFNNMILNKEIEIANRNITYHEKCITHIKTTHGEHPIINKIINDTHESTKQLTKNRNITMHSKFNQLNKNLLKNYNLVTNPEFVANISDTNIDDETLFALSLGHRFATYTPKHYNKKHHLIPDIEPILEEIEDEELRNTARSNIVKNIPTLSKKLIKKCPYQHLNI